MTTPTDAELVRRCLTGEPLALRELVQRFQQDVFGVCVKLLRHSQDAEDVSQEVFVRVFRSLNRWDSARPLRPLDSCDRCQSVSDCVGSPWQDARND